MYTNAFPGDFTDLGKGFYAVHAADLLPQSTTKAYFTVVGRCLITRFFGTVVTTIIQGTDPVLSWTTAPTVGTAVVLASTVDISSLEIGGKVHVEGDGTAMIKSNGGALLSTAVPCSCIVGAGSISLIAGASKTGSMMWQLWYFPLDFGASITGVAV